MTELSQGLFLMGMGLGTVFLFLALLILTTSIISRLVNRGHALHVPTAARATSTATAMASGAELTAVITAAITRHRAAQKSRSGV